MGTSVSGKKLLDISDEIVYYRYVMDGIGFRFTVLRTDNLHVK